MKLKVLKKTRQYELTNAKDLGIQAYTDGNNYPQMVMDIVEASVTGKQCVNNYSKFIIGQGFSDCDFYAKKINGRGDTIDSILNQIGKDYAMFGGFALHLNYNANFKIRSVNYVPFEHIRFEKLDENGHFSRLAVHHDWAKQFTKLRKFRKEDIVFIDFFDPNPANITEQVELAGGWSEYKGQIYYFSNEGNKTYPTPIYSPALTDMNTEEGISNVNNRNARSNFFVGGIFIDYVNTDESKEQENETEKSLKSFQGDENACKIAYIQCQSREEKPDFVSFRANSYDKEFDVTRNSVKDGIGEAFNQPPILRARDIGAGFGAELMKNAFDFYNSITENERLNIERIFKDIFSYWWEPMSCDYDLLPCQYKVTNDDVSGMPSEIISTLTINEKRALIGYTELADSEANKSTLAEKIGVAGVQSMTVIVADPTMKPEQKRGLLKLLFGLSDEEVNSVIPIITEK